MKFITFLGWTGVIAILLAYGCNIYGTLSPHSILYLVLNIFGSICIMIEAFTKKDYPSSVLNIVWALIAATALVQFLIA